MTGAGFCAAAADAVIKIVLATVHTTCNVMIQLVDAVKHRVVHVGQVRDQTLHDGRCDGRG